MRWQHAMMTVAHDDIVPTMTLADAAVEGDAPGRSEFVDRSGLTLEHAPPPARRRSVRRFLGLVTALVVLTVVAGAVIVGTRAVLDRVGSSSSGELGDGSRQETVGPLVVDIPRGMDVRDCAESNRGRECTHWEFSSDDSVLVVRVADLGTRADGAGAAAAIRAAAGATGAAVEMGGLTEARVDGRSTYATTARFGGVDGQVTALPMGRWAVVVLAVGDDSLIERHDEVLASARRS